MATKSQRGLESRDREALKRVKRGLLATVISLRIAWAIQGHACYNPVYDNDNTTRLSDSPHALGP